MATRGCLSGLVRWKEARTGASGKPQEESVGRWRDGPRCGLKVTSRLGAEPADLLAEGLELTSETAASRPVGRGALGSIQAPEQCQVCASGFSWMAFLLTRLPFCGPRGPTLSLAAQWALLIPHHSSQCLEAAANWLSLNGTALGNQSLGKGGGGF